MKLLTIPCPGAALVTHFDHSEEDIFLTFDGWCLVRGIDCELSSIRSVR